MAGAFQRTDKQPDYVDAGRAYQRAYYLAHREKKVAYARVYWAKNKDSKNAARRVVKRLNKIRGIQSGNKKNYNRRYHYEVNAEQVLRERIKALQIVGGQKKPCCVKCGEGDVFVLAINHKNGGGRKEVTGNPRGWWRRIVSGERQTSDLDVRCHNCNIKYEYERGQRKLPRNWQEVVSEATE